MQRLLYSYLCVSNDLRMRYIQLHPITRIAKEIEIASSNMDFEKKTKYLIKEVLFRRTHVIL